MHAHPHIWPLSPGPFAPARDPAGPSTHPALHGPRFPLRPQRIDPLSTAPGPQAASPGCTTLLSAPHRLGPARGPFMIRITSPLTRRTVGPGPCGPRPDSDTSHPLPTQRPVLLHPLVLATPRGQGGDSSAFTSWASSPLARDGNCGRAAAASSRCRIVPVIWPRSGGGAPTSRTTTPSPTRHITNSLATPSSYTGAPDAESPAKVGRVYPKPPRCSPAGDENGVRVP